MSDQLDPLQIDIEMENRQALQAARQVGSAMDRTATTADRAARRASATQEREARRGADAQVRESRRSSAAVARAADQAAVRIQGQASLQTRAWGLMSAGVTAGLGAISALGALSFDGFLKATTEAQKKTTEYASDLLKVKEQLKELATLKGLASASDDFVRQVAGFGRKTGLSIGQADEFQKQFYGSIAGGQQAGNIDQATSDKLLVEGARVASRQTKDFATRGDLLGILPQFRKYDSGDKGVHQALGDAEAVRLGLTEGRGDDAPLTQALLKVAGSLAGEGKMVGSLPELAAIVGVSSLSGGAGSADTRTEQVVRGLRGETPDQIKFLKDFAKIDEHDNLETRLDKFIPQLRAQKAAGRDPATFLTESGFNSEQSRAIGEVEANYEVLKKRLASARNGAKGSDIVAESDRQDAIDPLQRAKLAQADLQAAQLARGEERQRVLPEIDSAKARLVEEGTATSGNVFTMLGNFQRSLGSGFQTSGIDVRAQERAVADLEKRTGVEAPNARFARAIQGGGLTTVGNGIAQGVTSFFGGQASDINFLRMVEEQQKTTKAVQDAGKQPIVVQGRAPGSVR